MESESFRFKQENNEELPTVISDMDKALESGKPDEVADQWKRVKHCLKQMGKAIAFPTEPLEDFQP